MWAGGIESAGLEVKGIGDSVRYFSVAYYFSCRIDRDGGNDDNDGFN